MNDMLIARSAEFKDVKEKYWSVEVNRYTFSEVYLQILFTHDFLLLEKLAYQCFRMKMDKKYKYRYLYINDEEENEEEIEAENESDSDTNHIFRRALCNYIYAGDYEVTEKCSLIDRSFHHIECSNLKIRQLIRENLKNISDSYLSYMNQLINN